MRRCKESCDRLRAELARLLVGQEKVVEQVLLAVLAGGHALLEGVPGLGKTLLVRSLAEAAGLAFKRIPLTPDLMPDELIGTEAIQEDPQTGQRMYKFVPGPIFANMVLAEEINRTPPKTQAALLEVIQQGEVSAGGKAHRLPEPFFLLATQNPLEQEGLFPLAQARLDRFLLFIKADYPTGPEEWQIARRAGTAQPARISRLWSGGDVLQLQGLVRRLPVSDRVLGYAWALVRATRPGTPEAMDFVDRWVAWGAGPRGLVALVTCAKARAALSGRDQATIGDVQAVIRPALRHRIVGNQAAQANNLTSDRLIDMLLEAVPPDRDYTKPEGA
ncbi:MAG: AAA family ATPase [Thermoguttaceae bacterium]